jgi:hypothetical protein
MSISPAIFIPNPYVMLWIFSTVLAIGYLDDWPDGLGKSRIV